MKGRDPAKNGDRVHSHFEAKFVLPATVVPVIHTCHPGVLFRPEIVPF